MMYVSLRVIQVVQLYDVYITQSDISNVIRRSEYHQVY